MNHVLNFLNLIGVAALAVLCAVQWQANSRLDAQVRQLDQTSMTQKQTIADQQTSLRQNAADLQDLRTRISMSESDLKIAVTQRDRLNDENKQLKSALDQWAAALKARDAEIKHAAALIQNVAAERNDAIHKFNDLADKYNQLVKELNGDQSGK